MIRPITFITALMFLLSGAYLFAVKHRSQMMDNQLAATAQATRLDEQRIRVLQAQWALEVDPSRLAQLSTQFTTLQPMKPDQLVTLAALRSVLPPAQSAAPGPNPEDVVPAMPVAVPDAAVAQVTPAMPLPPDMPPVHINAAHPLNAAHPQPVHAPVRLASVETLLHGLPNTRQAHSKHVAKRKYVASHPEYASALATQSYPVPQRLIGAQVMSVRAVAPQPVVQPAPVARNDSGGSMLGMAQNGNGN